MSIAFFSKRKKIHTNDILYKVSKPLNQQSWKYTYQINVCVKISFLEKHISDQQTGSF